MKDILLGKSISSPVSYSPQILYRVLRSQNRVMYDIITPLPFEGYDIWHCYQISFLTKSGAPISCVGKIKYSSNSKWIVQSKSLKLYLNSFNMQKLGSDNPEQCITLLRQIIINDLMTLLQIDVQVSIFSTLTDVLEQVEVIDQSKFITMNYLNLDFNKYKETPSLLVHHIQGQKQTFNIKIPYLRSNCKVTHQPDWGTAYISITSSNIKDILDIYKYVASFRNENHFHEQVCEMIYKRLLDIYNPSELMVLCMYTRRGGIDICPIRATNLKYFIDKYRIQLLDINNYDKKIFNQ